MIAVLSILCLFFSAAAMSYQTFIRRNQLYFLIETITSNLAFAQNEAISLHTTIAFCPKGEKGTCGFDWSQGQLIVNARDNTVLRELPTLPQRFQLDWKSSLGKSSELLWRDDGFTDGQQGSFYVCDQSDHFGQSAQIIVLRTGRLRVVTGVIAGCSER